VGLSQLGAEHGDFLVALLVPIAQVGEQRLHGWLDGDDWRNGRRQGSARVDRLEADLPGHAVTGADLAARILAAAHAPAHGVEGNPELRGGLNEIEPIVGCEGGARMGV
jgi:hypothetical protein